MKSILLLLLSLLLVPVNANSQFLKGFGFKIGFHFSDNIWNYSDPLLDKYYKFPTSSRFFLELGFFGEFFNHKYLSFISEMTVNLKGSKLEYDKKDENGNIIGAAEIINRVNYISFVEKIKVRYSYKSGCIYFFAGPRLDLLYFKEGDADFVGIFDEFKSTVAGVSFGLGFEYWRFLLETQYDSDITDSFSSASGNIKNYLIAVRFGFKFGKLKYLN